MKSLRDALREEKRAWRRVRKARAALTPRRTRYGTFTGTTVYVMELEYRHTRTVRALRDMGFWVPR